MLITLVIIFSVILILTVTVSVFCFFKIFYSFKKRQRRTLEDPIPRGRAYAPYRDVIKKWIDGQRSAPHTDVSTVSFDGLKLFGRYYELKKGAPIEILFHGYKGNFERDLCGALVRCTALGHNALMVDQRACGRSEGRVITFGSKESRDCLSWVDFVIRNIDSDARIILTGISMGAATVMTATSEKLPDNVVGVLADCGYTSTRDIVKKVMRDDGYPADLLYPFARLGAILFGRFDPDARSPIRSMPSCSIPIIFFHGDVDGYVPCNMSEENYGACASEHKRLVITKGADHALCFPTDQRAYIDEAKSFFSYLY